MRVPVVARVSCVLLLGSCGCNEADAPAPIPQPLATATASSAAAQGSLRPTLRDQTRAPGLSVRSGTFDARPAWGFSDIGVDSSQIELKIVQAPRGAALAKLLVPGALAIVNGGYFEADFRPSGWLKQAGVQLAPKADTSKGGVLALAGREVYVGPFSGLRFEPELAVQSFPLIVEPDGSSGIHRDDGRRAARTVVCRSGSELHFIVIAAPRGDGPTLFESAELLRRAWPAGFGCRAALNLDGGPSSGVWFAPHVQAKQRPAFAPVAYGIALVPR